MAINVDITVSIVFIALTSYLVARFVYLFFDDELSLKKLTDILPSKNKTNSSITFVWVSMLGMILTFSLLSWRGMDLSTLDFSQNVQYFISKIGDIVIAIISAGYILGTSGYIFNEYFLTIFSKPSKKTSRTAK